ncbi:MAG: hypothetical protein ACI4SF_02310 [Oscillospiraceae bacterium]
MRDNECEFLKEICRCYGLETKTKDEERLNNRGETYAAKVYRQAIRKCKADAQEIIKKSKQDRELKPAQLERAYRVDKSSKHLPKSDFDLLMK